MIESVELPERLHGPCNLTGFSYDVSCSPAFRMLR